MGMFSGKTVFCIGSGPSLTEKDCRLIEQYGAPTIAINSSWKLAKFADIIYAGDSRWWLVNREDIDIEAQLWTCDRSAHDNFGINLHRVTGTDWNSGLRAIQFAEAEDAERIILVGYDCSVNKGTHWHGDHQKTSNPSEARCRQWARQFDALAKESNSEIINCSRETALTAFPRATLEEVTCLKRFRAERHHRKSRSYATS